MGTQSCFASSYWNEYAQCYDSLLHLTPYADMLREVAEVVCSLPKGLILDASCGTGNFEMVLQHHRHNASSLIGIDSSPAMLTHAREKCSALTWCAFEEADLNLPLPLLHTSCAHVVSINTLYAVRNPLYTLTEFFRVLQPSGFLHLVTPREGYENGLILKAHCTSEHPDKYWMDAHASEERESALIAEAISDVDIQHDMRMIAQYNRHIATNALFHFFDEYTIRTLIENAGFHICRVAYSYAQQDFFITAQKGDVQ